MVPHLRRYMRHEELLKKLYKELDQAHETAKADDGDYTQGIIAGLELAVYLTRKDAER